MGLVYAYSLGAEILEIKDFELNASFDPKKGSVVDINASGKVITPAANSAKVLGVVEGKGFKGLAQGGKYDAVTVTSNSQNLELVKVRIAGQAVYRVPLKNGASAPSIGAIHALTAYNETSTLDTAIVPATPTTGAGAIYQVVDYDADTKNAFVTIIARQIV